MLLRMLDDPGAPGSADASFESEECENPLLPLLVCFSGIWSAIVIYDRAR